MKNNINALRKQQGMTWEELAERTGIAKSSLHRMAYGYAKTIKAEYIDAVCTVLHKPLACVFEAEFIDTPLPDQPHLQERARKAADAAKA